MTDRLTDRMSQAARSWGADLFGVADMTPAQGEVLEWSGPEEASYARAISMAIKLPHGVVDQLPERHMRPSVMANYRHHGYDVINARLDRLASQVASLLQAEGYRTLPLPAAMTVHTDVLRGHVSNKMVAHLAGLGWIGKNCLLITPEAGPRVRLVTVLTMAPLETGRPMDQRCGDCRVCVDACPVSAFTGRNYVDGEPREARYDAHKCLDFQLAMSATHGRWLCGMCLYSCPVGRQASAELLVRVEAGAESEEPCFEGDGTA